MNSVGGFGIANVDIIFGNARRMPKLGEEVYSESMFQTGSEAERGNSYPVVQAWRTCKAGNIYWRRAAEQISGKRTGEDKIEYTNMLSTDEEDPVTLSCVVSCMQDRGIVSYKPEEAAFAVEKKKIYEFYEGCRIAFLSLEQKDLCRL